MNIYIFLPGWRKIRSRIQPGLASQFIKKLPSKQIRVAGLIEGRMWVIDTMNNAGILYRKSLCLESYITVSFLLNYGRIHLAAM